jgi:hypothetical protein
MHITRRTILILTLWAASLFGPSRSSGHGTPIVGHVVGGRLTATAVLTDDRGFAEQLAADPDEETYFNFVGSTTAPGFQLFDVTVGQQVNLEVLGRRDFTQPLAPVRWLWYWDPTTQSVGTTPNSATLIVGSNDSGVNSEVEFADSSPPAGPLHLANLNLASEIGTKQHFAAFFLPSYAAGATGAYGFFARLTAPGLEPSNPVLIALNHSLDADSFQGGAIEINAAARLPGDFDGNDRVDGADFLVWQRTVGSPSALAADATLDDVVDAADLAIWREGIGDVYQEPMATPVAANVPEPSAVAIGVVGVVVASRGRLRFGSTPKRT